MNRPPISESRRYDFPPLWVIPLLLLPAIGLILYVGLAIGVHTGAAIGGYIGVVFGLLGFIAALYLIARLMRKADDYLRSHDTGE